MKVQRVALLSTATALVYGSVIWAASSAHARKPSLTIASWQFQSVGLVPGEGLKISVHSNDTNPSSFKAVLLDMQGVIINDSGDISIQQAETKTVTIDYGAIKERANADGRKQITAAVVFSDPIGMQALGPAYPGAELFDVKTGHTFAIVSPFLPLFD
jgi:hypothetical protein